MLRVEMGDDQQAFVEGGAVVELQHRHLATGVVRQQRRVRVAQRDLFLDDAGDKPGLAQHTGQSAHKATPTHKTASPGSAGEFEDVEAVEAVDQVDEAPRLVDEHVVRLHDLLAGARRGA